MRALVIDDDPSSIDLIGTRLRSLGCEIVVAGTEDDAKRAVQTHRPDFALVDLKLHGDLEAGARIIRAIQELPESAGMSIVIHSVYAIRSADLPRHLPEGVRFLSKPCKRDELAQLVDSLKAGAGK